MGKLFRYGQVGERQGRPQSLLLLPQLEGGAGLRLDAWTDEDGEVVKGDAAMPRWTSDDLDRIGSAEELDLASIRPDGSLRNPVTIWVVRVGDDLYVRSWKGRHGAWFRGTQLRREGHIQAGGIDRDVTFVMGADDDVADRIDAAYRAKYRAHGARYVDPMVAPEARAATIKLLPRTTGS
jgi:hypothetical protein